MNWLSLGLPLLSKELIEQAARSRTYVVRVLYAALLYLVGGTVYATIVYSTRGNTLGALGRGGEFYNWLVGLQFAGIYLFMPAIACGAIASEKERNSFVLLVLTRLRPTAIFMEKFLGRIIPMFMFLLLCLPLLTIAYSLGGLTQEYLWLGILLLVVTVVQVGSVAIMCSAYFRTSVTAFVGCYLLGFGYMLGPMIFMASMELCFGKGIWALISYRLPSLLAGGSGYLFQWIERSGLVGSQMFLPFCFLSFAQQGDVIGVLFRCVPTLVTSAIFLLLARFYLLRRAFVEPRNLVLELFHGMDRFFRRLNENRLTRGIVLVQDSAAVPEFDPLTWREINKTALGSFRYLIRLFLVTEVPVFFLCTLIAVTDVGNQVSEYLGAMLFAVWLLAVLIVAVKASSVINVERTRQTLDVLLTTPLTGRSIVTRKMQGVWRLCGVVSVPLLTIISFKTWWTNGTQIAGLQPYSSDDDIGHLAVVYMFCSLLSVVVYLPLVSWLSVWFGLWMRHQARTIFGALAALAIWCSVPVFVAGLLGSVIGAEFIWPLLFMSPAAIVPVNEWFLFGELTSAGRLHEFKLVTVLPLILANFTIYGLIVVMLRSSALRRVDYCLGRLEVTTMKRFIGGKYRLLLLLATILSPCVPASAVQVRKTQWGFDGKIVSDGHNLLSVFIDNPLDQPVEVALRLERTDRGILRIGVAYEETVYLAPFQSRWVQYYPYVVNDSDDWRITWKDEKGRHELDVDDDRPSVGGRARVRLMPGETTLLNRSSWKSFPDDLFPASVTGTGTLGAVVIDYVPRWEAARRNALLEWIHSGGTLLVAPAEAGQYPHFTDELAVLNLAIDQQPLGRGKVQRVPQQVLQNYGELDQIVPEMLPVDRHYDLRTASSVINDLRGITATSHHWGIIHMLALTYLGLVFPGWYLLARQRVGYGTTLLAFVGLVALFSGVFNFVGRRGYGEATQVNSLAWARPIGKSVYQITEWCNAFATQGDYYTFSYAGEGHQFRLLQNGDEYVEGKIDSGAQGGMTIDIPLFASRSYSHVARVTGPDLSIDGLVLNRSSDGAMEDGKCTIHGLDASSEIKGIAVIGDKIFQLYSDEQEPADISFSFLSDLRSYLESERQYWPGRRNSNIDAEEQLRSLLPMVVTESLNVRKLDALEEYALPKNELRLFVTTKAPESWRITNPRFPLQRQLVVYELRAEIP